MFKKIKGLAENWLNKESPKELYPPCDFFKLCYDIRPGDVILVEGRSRVSEVIKLITQSRWTHAALYLGRLHDIKDPKVREHIASFTDCGPEEQLIIEGLLGQGTVISPLNVYNGDNLRICRPISLSLNDAHKIIEFTASHLGLPYNVRQLLDLARLLFPWSIVPRRWRSSLFHQHSGEPIKAVCSSMLAEAFSAVNYPILPQFKKVGKDKVELIRRNPKLFTPADFDYSPYFEVLKFPFWGETDKAHYRDLPWNKDGLMANDEEKLSITR